MIIFRWWTNWIDGWISIWILLCYFLVDQHNWLFLLIIYQQQKMEGIKYYGNFAGKKLRREHGMRWVSLAQMIFCIFALFGLQFANYPCTVILFRLCAFNKVFVVSIIFEVKFKSLWCEFANYIGLFCFVLHTLHAHSFIYTFGESIIVEIQWLNNRVMANQ